MLAEVPEGAITRDLSRGVATCQPGSKVGIRGSCEVRMKTLGEIEAAVCEGIAHFEQEYMGRGPKDIRAHLLGDLLLVRLQGVLTAAEQHLVTTLPAEKGRDLLKQVRTQLIETARPALEALVQTSPASNPAACTTTLAPSRAKRSWFLRWPRRHSSARRKGRKLSWLRILSTSPSAAGTAFTAPRGEVAKTALHVMRAPSSRPVLKHDLNAP